jgi:hypothetical protein
MADIGQLQSNTLQAAQKALDAGLINKNDFARMTDGTVSLQDVSQARNLVASNVGVEGPVADIARELASAITQQNQAQSSPRAAVEAVKDFFGSKQTVAELGGPVLKNIR